MEDIILIFLIYPETKKGVTRKNIESINFILDLIVHSALMLQCKLYNISNLFLVWWSQRTEITVIYES